jgi:hypothetical protein
MTPFRSQEAQDLVVQRIRDLADQLLDKREPPEKYFASWWDCQHPDPEVRQLVDMEVERALCYFLIEGGHWFDLFPATEKDIAGWNHRTHGKLAVGDPMIEVRLPPDGDPAPSDGINGALPVSSSVDKLLNDATDFDTENPEYYLAAMAALRRLTQYCANALTKAEADLAEWEAKSQP